MRLDFASGDWVQVSHGIRCVSIDVLHESGAKSAALLTPDEAMNLATDLMRQAAYAMAAGSSEPVP